MTLLWRIVLAGLAVAPLMAQADGDPPDWETLLRAPLAGDAVPVVLVSTFTLPPAAPVARSPGAGHTHMGPVFAYLLEGEIENQVEPDPPRVIIKGGFFAEAPMALHRFLRNRSTAGPATLLSFQVGEPRPQVPGAPPVKQLLYEPVASLLGEDASESRNVDLGLRRLVLPPHGHVAPPHHLGRAIGYVIEGRIEISFTADQRRAFSYNAGETFLEPKGREVMFINRADAPALMLLYHFSAR